MIIGPWAHFQFGRARESLRAGIAWFERHLQGEEPLAAEKPVRICLMGRQEWRSLAQWPPSAQPIPYFLQGNGRLGRTRPEADTPPDQYIYDPTDSTPSLGGPLLMPPWGPLDNRRLEARPDVVCYTTAPLTAPLEVIGLVRLVLFVRSSSPYTDFFGRLCEVGPDGGRSINVCDGLCRLRAGKGRLQPDGTIRIEVDLWATAYHFRPGHRLRLQVSSGVHPRWNRNLGTGEPLAIGTNYVPARQTIYHDADHPAALWLLVTDA